MIFADKLIKLRKQNGWSQEELAEKMDVTRQSVSKWEGAQSIPELTKIIKLSEIFGVSIDYLLKDEVEDVEFLDSETEYTSLRKVSMEEANEFLSIKAETSRLVAIGAFLCIISPILLLILLGFSESPLYNLSENLALGIGLIVLIFLIAMAAAFFVSSRNKTSTFDYIEEEIFDTSYGVEGMVRDKKEQYRNTYVKGNIIGSIIMILSPVPIFIGSIIAEENELLLMLMVSSTLLIVAIGATIFISRGTIWSSYEKLLQEGEYSRENKSKDSFLSEISGIYWLVIVAIFLGYSFVTGNWSKSWIIFAVSGVLYPAIIAAVKLYKSNK